ncbi:MAG: aquaporin [Actinomycetota bacterium]|nr:aquaporin [Actinomycetota bacterium]
MEHRKLVAEALGTALLVIVAVGVATMSFGFKLTGSSASAGVVTTALAFGFVLLALAYTLGPVSGCHVNPAVTLGFVVSGRMAFGEALGYWVAQFVGGIVGALALWGIVSGSPDYSRSGVGLGADGWGSKASMIGIGAGGAFAAEVVLTFIFVLVVLVATSRVGSPGFAGLAIGLGLAVVHLIGIPLTGTSVNPARSLGPAIIVGHQALSQVWLFIVAPLVGGAIAALLYRYLLPAERQSTSPSAVAEGDVRSTTATP